ncbi:hypothetical protein UC34_01050 [Pandoraea vervacti]|uniref:Translocator protein BipD n=1 Tax=Pandoraea vervacti TaxID=656178 RepID=A0ABM5SU37_9BURK|nr:IpaD/SipD/SspD family type III secretion system needle tip protein [Pandoraea vervacti]AJP55956.1 hypothetical protein UC34_01050 [Pandoraea vervacti]
MTESVSDRFVPWLMFQEASVKDPGVEGRKENNAPGQQSSDDLSPMASLLAGVVKSADRLGAALRSVDDSMSDLKQGRVLAAALDETLDDARIAALDLGSRLKGLAGSDIPVPDALKEQLVDRFTERPGAGKGNDPDGLGTKSADDAPKTGVNNNDAPENKEDDADDDKTKGDDDYVPPTDGQIWDKLVEVIGHMKEEFLKIFADAAKKYLDFSKELADIISKLSGWIENKKDGKEVDLDVGKLEEALQALKEKYSLPSKNAVLWPKQEDGDGDIKGGSKEDAEKWAKDLGLPEGSVKAQPEGSDNYVVVVDTGTIDSMITSLPKGENGKARMTTQQLEIWRTGFMGQESVVKTQVQGLSQRFATANATNENLVKLLSGAILAMSESNKGFFR